MELINLPGIGNSGTAHWQTLWEQRNHDIRRISPASWDAPDLEDWIAALDRTVAAARKPPVLIAHSLGCLLAVHRAQRSHLPVAGALLVAVPDPASAEFPHQAAGFSSVPDQPLGFPALMLSSSDDPYGTGEYARRCAQTWNAGLIELGAIGHINAASNLGNWEEGWRLLRAFCAGFRA
jgi:predicted alpha/beta hydrolase family esterase